MKILFIGDIVGLPGQRFCADVLRDLAGGMDLVIANGENAYSSGRGLTAPVAEALYDAGVELITLGNHAFDRKELLDFIDDDERIVRPANYPPGTPGRGFTVCGVNGRKVLLINLMGRTFLSQLDCPFRTVDDILKSNSDIRHVVVDMHAEVTSEKLAMAWYLDGRASLVVGTHTHVQTSDERILTGGTACITDVGMVGPRNGILGMERSSVIERMRTQMPTRFEVASGPSHFGAVSVELDDASGRAVKIERIYRTEA